MAKSQSPTELKTLIATIADDGRALLGQQLELARMELGQHVEQATGAVGAAAVGAGLLAAGGLLSGLAAGHLIHRVTGLPLWTSYGLAASAASAAGIALLAKGRDELTAIRPLEQSAAAAGENLQWLKEQVTTGG